jgi:predicted ATPase
MMKRLHLKNFTVFADANFEFSPGLNVLVGTNGTGKSHVLKVGYAVDAARFNANNQGASDLLTFAWTSGLYKLLPEMFMSGQLAPLIRWNAQNQAIIEADFGVSEKLSVELTPAVMNDEGTASIKTVLAPIAATEVFRSVFIPAKEILTLSWMLPGSEQIKAPIEKNYIDLLNQLRLLPLQKPTTNQAISALSEVLGGEVQEEGDKYYLVDVTGRRTGISMIAEGLRKFGTLQKLLANGSLTKSNTLYWDEPEANLNPALLRKLAAILAELARQGFQIILATHSMSLLKEFHILSREPDKEKLPIKYFGLNAEPGQPTTVVTRDDFKYLPDVVALEVELDQADDLEEIFARESH